LLLYSLSLFALLSFNSKHQFIELSCNNNIIITYSIEEATDNTAIADLESWNDILQQKECKFAKKSKARRCSSEMKVIKTKRCDIVTCEFSSE